MTVREHDADDVVESIAQVSEVWKDDVDAWLVFLWKENSDVNNQNLAVDFEAGHVSTDFADSA
jgi:hypothetical protein